ncbi:hypothetical protein [Neobacillus cucumis]|uniref:hypothetical protein n=1 Tax=Neobacillus cucumis TaxID=1740721 RepID=UPI002E1B374E|nr:hypothetical protein [Neobacillus cucumis]
MSYKIRQLPNLLCTEHFVASLKELTIPGPVKKRIKVFLLCWNQYGEEYLNDLLESKEILKQHCDFHIYYHQYEHDSYFVLIRGNLIVALFKKDNEELSVKDWEEVKGTLMQEVWE